MTLEEYLTNMRSHPFEPEREIGRERWNPNDCVDFSTPPLAFGSDKRFIVVDVSNTVSKYCRINSMVSFYHRVPLHDIMSVLLSFSLNDAESSPGIWDVILDWTEKRVGYGNESLLDDNLYIFYEQLILDLEREISYKSPEYMEVGDYIFHEWWDPTSIVLTRERINVK